MKVTVAGICPPYVPGAMTAFTVFNDVPAAGTGLAAALAAGRTYCPHFLGGGVGLLHSLHLLAAVRGPGLLEVDANPNPLREGILQDAFSVHDGSVSLPGGQGLGLYQRPA